MKKSGDAFEQNRRLGRGVNIIAYDPLWGSRPDARFTETHFRLIREAGFDHVRINLHPFKHMGDAPDYAVAPTWFDTLDWAVSQALETGLAVILDMHQFTAMAEDPQRLTPKFLCFWSQLADHCRDLPDSVYFELLNEPNGALELPEGDRNIIATVHYYHPIEFTHQGAPWGKHAGKTGILWDGTPDETAAVVQDLSKADIWSKQHDRPILLGEFGAFDKGDMASRAKYTSFVARCAEPIRHALIPPQTTV